MSVYAMSDLHGCYEKYIKMLDEINLCDGDTLYILGDVVDRGDGGIKILQDMMNRNNIMPIRGNHDFLAYRMLKMLTQSSYMYDEDELAEHFQMWLYDGGMPTLNAFNELTSQEQRMVLAYLSTFLIYKEIEICGKTYFLSHTVPEKSKMLDFENVTPNDLVFGNPEYGKVYFNNKIIVTEHTPTVFIDENSLGKIYKRNNHIAIDCGAVFGNPLGCICLNTLQEFYVE